MLTLQNVKKFFGGIQAARGVTLTIPEKQITALIGPNGAGKTTLFDIINGLIKPDSGKVIFLGEDITNKATFVIANLGISRTFQQVRMFAHLTIIDHLLMTETNDDSKLIKNIFYHKKIDKQKYERILNEFGVKLALDTLISEMSYGQRKLLQIAMSLNKPHRLLLLDEPVAGVNQVIQEKIEDILLRLKANGETMLIIDHDVKFVKKLADFVIALDDGMVIAAGAPNEVFNNPKVLEAYLGE